MEVMAGQNVEMIGPRLATQTLHTYRAGAAEPQSPQDKEGSALTDAISATIKPS